MAQSIYKFKSSNQIGPSFPFHYFDWIIMSKDIIWNTGREFGENIHPELKTFSVVVSSEMTPGFHIIVYAVVGTGSTKEIVAGSMPDSFLFGKFQTFCGLTILTHRTSELL